ncbi:MAG: ABC transporter substrate-binding protein [Candidatus Limnocylindrales bacterium]
MKHLASLLAVAALAAAACGSGSHTPPPESVPKSGGTLSVAITGDMVYADPALVSDESSMFVANQVVEGLVGVKPGTISEVVPVLASDLPTVSANGLTYTFKLRTGVKFHDGSDFNAAAVKSNYDRWKAFPKGDLQDHATYYAAAFGGFGDASNLVSVEAPDGATVVFKLQQPQSNFLLSQTGPAFGILSPTSIEANDGNNPTLTENPYALGKGGAGKAMVGTGPFMFSEWKPNDQVTLVKNGKYWNAKAQPYLDRIVFRPYADATAALGALQTGAVDLVGSLDPAATATVRGSSGLRVLHGGSSCTTAGIYMNLTDPMFGQANPLANKNVRFAIAAAVEKQSYINAFYAGEGAVADNWMPATAQYYKREYLPSYDITRARSYVAQSGLSGSQLTLDLWYPSGAAMVSLPDPKGLAQAIAQDLQVAGFTVNVKTEALTPNYESDQAGGRLAMWLSGRTCRWGGPDDFLSTGLFRYINTAPSPEFGYRNDDLNAAMTAALSAADTGTAKSSWQKAQDLIAADMPTVPLIDVMPTAGARSYVVGLVGSGRGMDNLGSVWLNK